MLCRYCSSLYNKAWHLPPAKNAGQCKVVLCAKQTQHKNTDQLMCLYTPREEARLSVCICGSVSLCEWTEGQQCMQMDRWVVQGSSRCLKWPLLPPFIEPLASTQRQGRPQTLNTLACALMPEVTTFPPWHPIFQKRILKKPFSFVDSFEITLSNESQNCLLLREWWLVALGSCCLSRDRY